MAGRGWTAGLLLFAVLFMHGLQCGSAADGAAHSGAAPVVSVAVAAPVVGDAHRADAAADHAGPEAAVPHAADHATAGAVLGGDHGDAPRHGAGHLWAVCLAVLAAGLALLLGLLGSRLVPRASAALNRALTHAAGSLPMPRPPDLHALCLLRT
ncbi:hypothetical protein SAMN05660350_02609 [Geodermatophilus obscurus]|uniref:Uncharacterized protein n=1 Tax=Geodermatophilus obscurus TaxID=1861 RepID=A0A1M7U633_9ACTN|nr:hypothetical protein [Geodermatophilus obscurus]SHN78394.1 hypothetical protein SAMN05660350_02609 [Geodermatophilus obscurus]